jgi:hypothetical protein
VHSLNHRLTKGLVLDRVQSQVNIGVGPRPSSQDGVSQLQDPVPLSLPQLNHLVEVSFYAG